MASPIAKLAPTAVVAAMVTYCCWPHLTATPFRRPPQAAKLPGVALQLLSPATIEPSARDPFQARSNPPTAVAQQAEPKSTTKHETTEAVQPHSVDPRDRWVLNATLLRGDRRLAVINGELYATGEPLPALDPAESRYFVRQIDAEKVVIAGGGETVDLHYEDLFVKKNGSTVHRASAAPRDASHAITKRPVGRPSATKPNPTQLDRKSQRRHE